MRQETLTQLLVNLASIVEVADEALLPGVYKEVGAALQTDPTGLSSLTLFRSLVQTFCYPLAAYLAIRHNRAHVIAFGSFLWAAATILFAVSSNIYQAAICRGMNGIGLAIAIPAIQSLIADSTDESNRGLAFGWLQLTGELGSIIGTLCSILMASTSFMGIPGWRIAFHLVGITSIVVGILVGLFANDPRFSDDDRRADDRGGQSFISEMKDLMKEGKSVIRIPSFQIIVAQGMAGTFPGKALSFVPMWLELIGYSHGKTALIVILRTVGAAFGSVLGGRMGDILAKAMPNSGRILLSQISASSRIPIAALFLLILPQDPSSLFMHGLVYFFMGLFMSWNAPATNNPIFAEIVPEKSRTTIYALDRTFESILSSSAPTVVALLAQRVYGYKTPSKDSGKIERNRENAASLAKGIFMVFLVTMSACIFIYFFLYCTYPIDREKARMTRLAESEMQQTEAEESPFLDQLHVSLPKEQIV